MDHKTQVAVFCEAPARTEHARRLAQRMDLPVTDDPGATPFLLTLTEARLELRQTGPNAPGPVYVDQLAGRLGYRLRRDLNRRQPLARACGLRHTPQPRVLDATAGLGRDAAVLAALGCRVTMVERSEIMAALLRDGLDRAHAEAGPMAWIRERLHLRGPQDAIAYMAHLPRGQHPEVVYLDPMYPQRAKAARVRKEMQALQELIGRDADADRLLARALETARSRVVVKRPRGAAPLEGPRPSFPVEAKNTRYDVYMPVTPGTPPRGAAALDT